MYITDIFLVKKNLDLNLRTNLLGEGSRSGRAYQMRIYISTNILANITWLDFLNKFEKKINRNTASILGKTKLKHIRKKIPIQTSYVLMYLLRWSNAFNFKKSWPERLKQLNRILTMFQIKLSTKNLGPSKILINICLYYRMS